MTRRHSPRLRRRPPPDHPTPKRGPAAASPPGDELAFLKSVSEEERKPGPRRPSNPGGGASGHTGSRAVETSVAPASNATAGKTATPTGAKTLEVQRVRNAQSADGVVL